MGGLGSERSGSLAVVEDGLKLDLWTLKRQGYFARVSGMPLAQSNGPGWTMASRAFDGQAAWRAQRQTGRRDYSLEQLQSDTRLVAQTHPQQVSMRFRSGDQPSLIALLARFAGLCGHRLYLFRGRSRRL